MEKRSKREETAFGCAKTGILLFAFAAFLNMLLGLQTEATYAHGALREIAEPLPDTIFYASAYIILFTLVGFLSSECLRWLYASTTFQGAGMFAALAPALYLLATFFLEHFVNVGDVRFADPELIGEVIRWMNRFHVVSTCLSLVTVLMVVPVMGLMKGEE